MDLQMIGQMLGAYQVLSKLGEGGMGEVYRAKDTRLDRIVAIKILPATFAADSDRVMRFTREARTLAALNHPHIAQVYDIGHDNACAFIVMEMVEGENLSTVIAGSGLKAPGAGTKPGGSGLRAHGSGTSASGQPKPLAISHEPSGGLPLDEALPIARQIADALAAAHDAGIIHRDLKPANIQITDDGVVKVLDFGLSKAIGSDDSAASSDAAAATMTSPAMPFGLGSGHPEQGRGVTMHGMILGTASYMAPEQAKGRPVDRRADVWAFGVVLYEMLTGARLFGRDDVSDTLAAVLTHEPDLSKLPPATPPAVRRLIERCLDKDKKTRLDSMAVARHELDEAISGTGRETSLATVASPMARRGLLGAAALTVAALATGIFGTVLYFARQAPPPAAGNRLVAQIVAPSDVASAFSLGFALSPDGQTLAFAARNKSGLSRIWLRRLDTDAAHEVPGTDGGSYPFWAPDSHTFAFFADDKLKRVDIDGGSLQTICATPGRFQMGSWSVHDEIVWGSANGKGSQLHKVPATGGTPIAFDGLGEANGAFWLPSGRRFVYADVSKRGELRIASSDGTSSTPVPSLPPNGWDYSYGGGFLLLNRNGALTAQRLDEASGTVVGQPIPIAPVAAVLSAWFAVSSNGDRVLALLGNAGNATARLVWANRQGDQVGTLGAPGSYWQFAVAPDGKSAIASTGPDFQWLRPDAPPLRVTTDGTSSTNISPAWHSSGLEFAYLHTPSTIIRRPLDPQGQSSVVLEDIFPGRVDSWSKDGRWLLFSATLGNATTDGIFLYDFATKSQRPWLANGFTNRFSQFSPDGKWVAYGSDVSGKMEIYLRAFEGEGQAVAVSAGGGAHPFWRGDGSELFYLGPADEVMTVSLTRSGLTIVPGKPKQLFRIPLNDVTRQNFPPYGVSPDGQRFLLNVVERPAPLFLLQGLAGIVK